MELKEKYTIDDLRAILIRLREPDGCPWDMVQTHQSIKKSLIEETYEAIDALDFGDDHAFANELGDVLLQVVFHARLAEERGAFSFDDVVTEICTKLITRHTHVFGKDHAGTVEESLNTWEKNKKKEKNISTYTGALRDVPKYLPALMRAEKIQKKARGFGFDWDNIEGVYEKLAEETQELKEAQNEGVPEHIREEYGDLLFSVVNLGRFLDTDPETALTAASNKFINRFEKMEEKARGEGKDLAGMSMEEMDSLWNEVK
ncbi:MAG: nucleoside triphosphate pyrophosphohydrolase [Candidatus Ornithomonoglobus sp.]